MRTGCPYREAMPLLMALIIGLIFFCLFVLVAKWCLCWWLSLLVSAQLSRSFRFQETLSRQHLRTLAHTSPLSPPPFPLHPPPSPPQPPTHALEHPRTSHHTSHPSTHPPPPPPLPPPPPPPPPPPTPRVVHPPRPPPPVGGGGLDRLVEEVTGSRCVTGGRKSGGRGGGREWGRERGG